MKKLQCVLATFATLSLIVIAVNLTIMTSKTLSPSTTAKLLPVETPDNVMEVISKVSVDFDGFGADVGYLVKDGNRLTVAHVGSGSMLDRMVAPKYLTKVMYSNGETHYWPLSLVN